MDREILLTRPAPVCICTQQHLLQVSAVRSSVRSPLQAQAPAPLPLVSLYLVGGFKHVFFSISYMGCHPSHWRTHMFQDGYCTTNQLINHFFQKPHLVGGLEHAFYFSIYWECHHPNCYSLIFFREVGWNHQPGIAVAQISSVFSFWDCLPSGNLT